MKFGKQSMVIITSKSVCFTLSVKYWLKMSTQRPFKFKHLYPISLLTTLPFIIYNSYLILSHIPKQLLNISRYGRPELCFSK